MADEDRTIPLANVITIDDERIRGHLDRVVRGTVEETLNALLDAEAAIAYVMRSAMSERRLGRIRGRVITSEAFGPRLAK